MADQYGHHLPDEFRQLMTHFPLNPPQGAGSSAESYFFHSRNNVALPLLPHHHHQQQQQQQQHDTTIMVGEVVQLPGGGLLRFGGHDRDHHHHHHHHHHTSNTSTPAVSTNTGGTSNIRQQQQHVQQQLNINGGVEMESGIWSFGNEGGGAGAGGDNNSRWPRQETLTLLEIRSRLDSKFKEANHKKPLWDEVSRIMAEEYGYYRSEKKCREKFENLYKYYKKTKDGKAGRQDGKHYRFFRQLEALYGETSNNLNNQMSASESHPLDNHHQNTSTLLYQNPNNQSENQEINEEALDNIHDDHHHQKLSTDQSLSVSNTSEFETASSENNIDHHDDDLSAIAFMMNQKSRERQKSVTINESRSSDTRKIKRSWKVKVENFIDSQMRKVMESQEAWMERMLKTIEDREQDRLFKEEKWRKQEMARFDREHGFWAKERARIEARDAALMEALQIFTGRSGQNDDHMINSNIWTEPETSSLIQIVSSLEPQFQEDIWEELSAKMASLGYYKSAIECKEKLENMHMYFSLANKKHMKQSTLESMDLINEEKKFWEKGKNKQV